MADTRLENKVAIITGGAQGIGYAIAERFARDGAKVVIGDVADEEGAAAETALKKINTARFVSCNVAEKLDVHNLVASTLDEFGRIDILVNNAGIVATGDFLDISEDDFDRVVAINLKGSFLCGQAVAQHMVEQVKAGGAAGTIINMSSVNAVLAIPNQVPYSVSKGGINQLTKVMALSLAPYGIRVNAIGPGSIMTKILEAVAHDKPAMDRIMSRTPLGRLGAPSEIASIASFLASEDASYMTGQTLYADGGRMPLNYTVPIKR